MKNRRLEAISLSQIRALVAVADQGNFGKAALSLNVSQAAISHAIATLEEELGVVLAHRGRQGSRLTEVGEHLLPEARQILQALIEIRRKARLGRGVEIGELRIATYRSLATHLLPQAMAKFQQRYPGITISLFECPPGSEPDVERVLRAGEADVGLTALPVASDFDAWELVQDEYMVLIPNSDPPAPDPLTWEQLSQYPLILPGPATESCTRQFLNFVARFTSQLNIAYEIYEDSTIVSMVAQGLGITVLPRLAAMPIPQSIQVRSLPTPLYRTSGACVLADKLYPPVVYLFLDILREFYPSAHRQKVGVGD